MSLSLENHRVVQARQMPSPNANERPAGESVRLIVVHSISLPPKQFGGPWIDQLFCNALPPHEHPYFAEICHLQVSSHFLIRRDGELVQYVPCDQRAWHAGQSHWCGRDNCNDFSIGIELEGDDHTPYTEAQYRQLAGLISLLRAHYPDIAEEAVVGHEHIAPGRKTDPGPAFDWDYLAHCRAEQEGHKA